MKTIKFVIVKLATIAVYVTQIPTILVLLVHLWGRGRPGHRNAHESDDTGIPKKTMK